MTYDPWEEILTPDEDSKPDIDRLSEQELVDEAKRVQKEVRAERRMSGEFKAAFMELLRSHDPRMRDLALLIADDKCFSKKFPVMWRTDHDRRGQWVTLSPRTLTGDDSDMTHVFDHNTPITYEYLRARLESGEPA